MFERQNLEAELASAVANKELMERKAEELGPEAGHYYTLGALLFQFSIEDIQERINQL